MDEEELELNDETLKEIQRAREDIKKGTYFRRSKKETNTLDFIENYLNYFN